LGASVAVAEPAEPLAEPLDPVAFVDEPFEHATDITAITDISLASAIAR
jgi:hypothetical protein